ncbi:MAG: hypothetical protein HFI42_04245 [Lachnospiraceae bacterium]|nr:hypothetical protein [Lachnospiraceae bacterium]
MLSKRSFFSKTIFLKNITLYWPVWACWLLVCLYRLPFRIFVNLSADFTDIAPAEYDRYLEQQFLETVYKGLSPFLLFLFAAITAITLFSYLYQARSAHMIHALPVCRESLYLTNLCSGLCFLVIPQLLSFLASIFVCFFLQMTHLEGLLHWLLLSLGMTLAAFALAVFTALVTGHMAAAYGFFIIFNYAFVVLRSQVQYIMSTISYGMTLDFQFGDFLSPLYFLGRCFGTSSLYLNSNGTFHNDFLSLTLKTAHFYVGIYAIAALALFFLAYLIYRKRQLESAGDIITVHFLKPVFRWGAAYTLGGLFAYLGTSIIHRYSPAGGDLLPLIPLLLAAEFILFFASEMVLQKSFRIFQTKRLAESGALLAITLIFVFCVHKDILRLEQRVPKEEEIEMACISGTYPIRLSPEDYETLLGIHQKLASSKKDIQSYFNHMKLDASYTSLNIYYNLKNGTRLARKYFYPVEERYLDQADYVLYQIMSLSHRPEYYLQYHFTDAYEQLTFVEGSLGVYINGDYLTDQVLDQDQCRSIFDAFQKDVQEGNYRIYSYPFAEDYKKSIYANTLFLDYTVPKDSVYTGYDGEQCRTFAKSVQSTAITLTTDCVHTLEALGRLGIITEERRLITEEEFQLLMDDTEKDLERIFHQ